MFMGLLLLLLSTVAADDYNYELKHIENPECKNFKPTGDKIIIKETDLTGTYYLRECKNIKDVEYDGTTVQDYAFYASSITSIKFVQDTISIKKAAFAYCKDLTQVTFNKADNKPTISEGAFYRSGVTNIVNLRDVEVIGKSAFEGCPLNAKDFQLSFPKITTIGPRAFYGTKLSTITFNDDLETIDESAFQYCESLSIGGGKSAKIRAKTINRLAFANCPLIDNVAVQSSSIGESAFQCDPKNSKTITRIEHYPLGDPPVSYSLNIDKYAFYGRTISLNGLETYRGLTIKEFAFAFCTFNRDPASTNNDYGIRIINENGIINIGDHAFYRTKLGSSSNNIFKLVIDDCVSATIGFHAFESSEGHLNFTYTDNSKSIVIKDYAFYRSGIYNSKPNDPFEYDFIKLLEKVTSIGKKSFAECQLIGGAVYIKDKVISEYAFYNCRNLKKIIIHNAEEIQKGAFEACTADINNLTITTNRGLGTDTTANEIEIQSRAFYASGLDCNLVLHSFITSIGEYAFAYCTKLVTHSLTIYSPKIEPFAFASCGKFTNQIVIYSEEIKYHFFDENVLSQTSDITIGGLDDEVTSTIKTEAFYDIEFKGLVNIHELVTIEYNAFQMCKFGKNIVINGTIDAYAFDNCTVINTGVVLSIGATNIGNHAFQRFGQLNTFTLRFHNIQIGSKSIGQHAFYEANISDLVEIPWCFNSIGNYAFSNCIAIKTVVVNNSNIGDYAFLGCQNLEKLELYSHGTFTINSIQYKGMTEIGTCAFYSLPKLSSDLIIPSYVSTIGNEAFANCGLIPLLVIEPESALTNFNSGVFANCVKMAGQINITKSIVNIASRAFYGCKELTKLVIHDDCSLETIGESAFQNCENMDGVLDFPDSLKSIGDYAFSNCIEFSHHITIKSKCTIGDYAFNDCSKIKRVELDFPPYDSDTDDRLYRYIGKYAFTGLPVYNNYHSDDYDDDNDGEIDNTGDEEEDDLLTIPEYIFSIGESAFESCTGLRRLRVLFKDDETTSINYYNYANVQYPGRLIGLGYRSFYGSSVRNVSIIGEYTKYNIRDCAFNNCQKLVEEVNIEGGSFGHCIFANCNSLVTGISINGGTFGDYIFANCSSLKGPIYINGGDFGNYLFQNCISIAPYESEVRLGDYLFQNITFIMEGGSLGRYPFEGCTKFGGLVILGGDAHIKESAFENFNMPFTLVAPSSDSTVQVDRRAFYNCALIGALDIKGVSQYGNEAFANCRNTLTSLTIYPRNDKGRDVFINTKFGNDTDRNGIVPLTVLTGSSFTHNLFHNCNYFNRLYFETKDSSYSIPYKAFYEMSNLQDKLIIPSSITIIGEYAFSGCGFYHVVFESQILTPSTSPTIKEGAFYNCKNLNDTINFGNIATISKRAFAGCSRLPSIDFGTSNLPIFERSAFEDCSSLDFKVNFPTTKPGTNPYIINKYAFSGCSSLEGTHGHLIIPAYIDTIDDYAFQGCAFQHLEFKKRDAQSDALTLGVGAFSGCKYISFDLVLPYLKGKKIPDRSFSGCSRIQYIEYPDNIKIIGKYAFNGCSGVKGPLEIPSSVKRIEDYAFAGCSGYSGSLTINVEPSDDVQTIIGPHAFEGCSGFKKGELHIFVENDEESFRAYGNTGPNQNQFPYFRYRYFLRIGTEAFKDTKFKNVYYNGRFQPDCDYDIGFSHTKGIHTSSNYLNKSFCSYPLHSDKLSGGAIAGITIAVIVVVAAIVLLVLFLICRNKKNKDNSEDEVEMNADP